MISKIFTVLMFCLLFFTQNSCDKKDKALQKVETNTSYAVVLSDTIAEKTSTVIETPIVKSNKVNKTETKIVLTKPAQKKSISASEKYKIYSNLKQILNSIGLGETKTKQQLIDSRVINDEALEIVKSVTKVSDNELAIAWKSTWLVEKISDVKLKDEKIKVEFKNGLVYTSGNAIGIKYEGKIYHDLIIKGDKAYIPSVKKYSWRIGK